MLTSNGTEDSPIEPFRVEFAFAMAIASKSRYEDPSGSLLVVVIMVVVVVVYPIQVIRKHPLPIIWYQIRLDLM